jgi:ketosteroid isomerase-like protein
MSDSPYTALKRSFWGLLHDHLRIKDQPSGDLARRVQRLEDELALRDLLNTYTYYYDGSDLEGVVSVFTEDATLVNPRGTYVGAQAIRTNYAYNISNRKLSFHYASNVVVRVSEDGKEAAISAFYNAASVYASRSLASNGGSYSIRARKTAAGWKIAEMRITYNYRARLAADNPADTLKPFPTPTRPESSKDWIGPDAML